MNKKPTRQISVLYGLQHIKFQDNTVNFVGSVDCLWCFLLACKDELNGLT